MKFADEILNNKKVRLEQKLKEHNALVNEEMLAIEKAINTYENDDENNKPYIDIQMIIKTEESKESLKEHGFFIDKVSQYIPYGTTRVYLDKTSYEKATKSKYSKFVDNIDYGMRINSSKDIKEKSEEKINKDNNIKRVALDEEMNLNDVINFIESLTKR